MQASRICLVVLAPELRQPAGDGGSQSDDDFRVDGAQDDSDDKAVRASASGALSSSGRSAGEFNAGFASASASDTKTGTGPESHNDQTLASVQ
jgi:hypothetical protein